MDTKVTQASSAPQAPQAPTPQRPVIQPPDFSAAKKKSRRKRVIILVVVLLLVAVAIFLLTRTAQTRVQQSASSFEISTAELRDLSVTLDGSGALKAADSYTVTSLLQGDILSAPFEEGAWVNKNDILYVVDSSDLLSTIERAELTLSQSRTSYNRKLDSLDDLTLEAKEPGTVTALLVKEGDSVVAGQTVATVRDSSVMQLILPFGADDAQQLYIGQQATVTLEASYEALTGTISEISRVDQTLVGNMLVRSVTIDVPNPGGIAPSHTATAQAGGFACNSAGTFSYKSDYTLVAGLSGDVQRLHVKEGDTVAQNQLIMTLDSALLDMEVESAGNSVRDAEINLESQQNRLDDYTIQSPISGTIIEKNYKEGDTLESGRVLCTIFDLTYLSVVLNIDELDIAQVSVGQQVSVTADAVSGKTYEGVVTKVNINGTTLSGVTAYPVTIRIDSTDGLLPGMNADATIEISQHKGVLTVPVDAVLRGDRVLVERDPNAVESKDNTSGIPAGFEYVNVELGASDGQYVQILSGLEPGDRVAYTAAKQGNSIMTPFGRVDVPEGGMMSFN